MSDVSPEVVAQLAPTGILRAAINMSNFLLVVGKTDTGEPIGPSPSIALAISEALGVPLKLVPFRHPVRWLRRQARVYGISATSVPNPNGLQSWISLRRMLKSKRLIWFRRART